MFIVSLRSTFHIIQFLLKPKIYMYNFSRVKIVRLLTDFLNIDENILETVGDPYYLNANIIIHILFLCVICLTCQSTLSKEHFHR